MKREKDRFRALLVRLEEQPNGLLIVGGTLDASVEERKDAYHLSLMQDEGLALEVNKSVWRLTAIGHDAAEAIGGNEVWERLRDAGPAEAYDIVKNLASTLTVTAISKLMGWG